MPPRFAYWTILVGGLPTAFRAAEREEIEPTFRRLKQKHPDAEMRWFARGKLWASPAEASEALSRQKAEGTRPKNGFGERRGREWRPGGSHRDPRQGYIDAKKRENQRKRERRFEFKQGSRPQAPGSRAQDESRQKAKGEGQKEEPRRWERPGPKWGPPRQDRRPEVRDRRPPKTDDRRPKTDRPWSPKPAWKPKPKPWRGPEPGARSPEPRTPGPKKWERPAPKWKGSRPHEERPTWKRPAGAEGPESEKRWKPQSRPGAWSPKPGAPASKPSWKPKPKPWRGPEPGARGPESRDRRPETGDRRPPKTEDRRPKTDRPWSPKPPGSGQPRGRWAGKGHGPRGPKR